MHSSGMRTACLLTVTQHALWQEGRGMCVPARGSGTCWGFGTCRGVPAGGVPAWGMGTVHAQEGVYLYLPGGVPVSGYSFGKVRLTRWSFRSQF